ncbi:MAG: hypothetical protein JW822_00150 [Spirochaetales bacterium]|nr:hypothetical protein [Spirochaetales bacterium]
MKAKSCCILGVCLIFTLFIITCTTDGSLLTENSGAAPLAQAEELFRQEKYQEALQLYEKIHAQAGSQELQYKTLHRQIECLGFLFRYGEAAQKLLQYKLPEDGRLKAWLLILKAEVLQGFLQQYGYSRRSDVIEGADDVFRLTRAEINAEIISAYRTVWRDRELLLNLSMRDQKFFIELEEVNFNRHPTLCDFFVLSFSGYLAAQEDKTVSLTTIESIIDNTCDHEVAFSDSPLLLAAALRQWLSDKHGERFPEAAEYWRIQRLIVPFQNFPYRYRDRYKELREQERGILLSWMQSHTTQEGKAEAGYLAAEILNEQGRYAEAMDLCEQLEKQYPETEGASQSAALRLKIQLPYLYLEADNLLPSQAKTVTLHARNLDQVYFRMYKPDLNRLVTDYDSGIDWSRIIRYPDENWLRKRILNKQTPVKEWRRQLDAEGPYQPVTTQAELPEMGKGVYVLMVSDDKNFTEGSALIYGCVINITDLMLVGSFGRGSKTLAAYNAYLHDNGPERDEDQLARFYTLNAETGAPVSGASVDIYYTLYGNANTADHVRLTSQADGSAALTVPVDVTSRSEWGYVYPLIKKDNAYSYWNTHVYFNSSLPVPLELFIQTDRPIYRPEQTVQAKVTAVKRTAQGFFALDDSYTVDVYAQDANGKVFFEKTLTLNRHGSAGFSFSIPKGRLLGRYSIAAHCNKDRLYGSRYINFAVEEYKRPEFEINFDQSEEEWIYNRQAVISGNVRYYFGGAVADADITYRIKRELFIPWYYRYWYAEYFNNAETEVAWGRLRTDKDGNFKFSFVPAKDENAFQSFLQGKLPDISSFSIEVEARDAGGRTITARAVSNASECGYYLNLQPEKGFFNDNEKIVITAIKQTVNDTPLSGSGTFKLYRLKDTAAKTYKELGKEYHTSNGAFSRVEPLELQLAQVPDAALSAQGTITFAASGKGLLTLAPLAAGSYRLYVDAGDKDRRMVQELIVIVIPFSHKNISLNATSVMLSQKKEYEVGEDALFVLGSGCVRGNYFIEIYKGQFLLKRDYVKADPGATVYKLPVERSMKGGFTLRWFSVTDMQVYHGELFVPVSEKDKKLNVSLSAFNRELKPGENASWEVEVNDVSGKPVQAEVLALMYDRSLEYYSTNEHPWLSALYGIKIDPQAALDATFRIYGIQFQVTKGALYTMRKQVYEQALLYNIPYLRIWRSWMYGRGLAYNFKLASGELSESEVTLDMLSDTDAVTVPALESKVPPESPEQPNIRTDFSETAFFLPHLLTDTNGRAGFSFTAPEQLAGWRVKLFAFTADACEGMMTAEAVTKKDLMVRLDIPRFFREKDEGSFTVFVHNESATTLSGKLVVTVSEDGKTIHEKIKLSHTEKSFTLPPHSQKNFDWAVVIPTGVSTYVVKAVVATDDAAVALADAEQRELPILPSRERLIKSLCVALAGTETKTLRFKIDPDPTRISESMHLQLDPQLALSLLHTIPYLVNYPFECVEQLLNKYVPLAVMQRIYETYPELKKAVAKIPKRHTVAPAWEKDDPGRQLELLETPWMWQAEGRPGSYGPPIDMLDPEVVDAQKEYVLERLRQAQAPNGAFPWWPGGREDIYITLYVLAGFAEAKAYGVEVPEDIIRKALAYVQTKIPAILNEQERNLALTAYAAYVVTSYARDDFSEVRALYETVPSWLAFVDKNRHALTPLGKAYVALGYFRTGNSKRAAEIVDTIMDSAREDAMAGVYWTPEKYSWLWYSDTVEKHAFMIRVLVEMRPDDARIPGLVQWLFFNRKGNVWKSTKASVQAVYSLLDFLKQRGALSTDEIFHVTWGGVEETVTLKPDDWLEKPIRYSRVGEEITPSMQEAVIEKQGKGIAFASMVWVYSTDELPRASGPGLIEIERTFYRRVKQGDTYHLQPLVSGSRVAVGEQIEVRIKINTKSQFEYLHLKDPKASGFEAEVLLSGWKYDPLWYYEEPRDSLTNFFFSRLPHGEYVLRYRLRPTKKGRYRVGAAVLQSMYAPEMSAHSDGFIIVVE